MRVADVTHGLDPRGPITVEDIKRHEHIKRQITAVVPYRVVYGETCRKYIQDDPNRTDLSPNSLTPADESIIKTENLKEWRKEITRYKFKTTNAIIADFLCGVLHELTQPNGKDSFASFKLYEPTHNDYIKEKNITVYENDYGGLDTLISLVISRQGIYKLAMGATVDDNGRVLHHLDGAVSPVKRHIDDILCGREPVPRLFVAAAKDPQTGHLTKKESRPLWIHSSYSNTGRPFKDAFEITIDPYFFPFRLNEDGNFVVSEMFIPTVAGLSSVLSVGRRYLAKKFNFDYLPLIAQIHRVILFFQLAMSYESFHLNEKFIYCKNGRYNLPVDSIQAVRELYPAAMEIKNGNPYIHYTDFIHFLSTSTNCLLAGVRELGIVEEISNVNNLIFPAIDKSAEFDKKIVKLKAEPFYNIAPFDYNKAALRYINSVNTKRSRYKYGEKEDFRREIPQTIA